MSIKPIVMAFGLVALTMIIACSDDFIPIIEAEEIPVVYGIINPQDSVFYITLTRTFPCNEGVVPCSMDPDKLYFKSAKVVLEVLTDKGQLLNQGTLYPLVLDNPNNKEGLFNAPQKIIYAITRDKIMMDGTMASGVKNLILKISTPEYSKLIYARTVIRQPLELLHPRVISQGTRLDFFSPDGQAINWRGFADDYYEGMITIHYSDHYRDSINFKSVQFGFKGTPPVNPESNPDISWSEYSYRIYGDIFLEKISKCFKSVKTDPDLVLRKFESLDVAIISTTHDYYDYIYSVNHDSDVEVAQKTNIVNGFGIFSSKRVALSKNNYLNINVLDSLANSPTTKWIKFTKWY